MVALLSLLFFIVLPCCCVSDTSLTLFITSSETPSHECSQASPCTFGYVLEAYLASLSTILKIPTGLNLRLVDDSGTYHLPGQNETCILSEFVSALTLAGLTPASSATLDLSDVRCPFLGIENTTVLSSFSLSSFHLTGVHFPFLTALSETVHISKLEMSHLQGWANFAPLVTFQNCFLSVSTVTFSDVHLWSSMGSFQYGLAFLLYYKEEVPKGHDIIQNADVSISIQNLVVEEVQMGSVVSFESSVYTVSALLLENSRVEHNKMSFHSAVIHVKAVSVTSAMIRHNRFAHLEYGSIILFLRDESKLELQENTFEDIFNYHGGAIEIRSWSDDAAPEKETDSDGTLMTIYMTRNRFNGTRAQFEGGAMYFSFGPNYRFDIRYDSNLFIDSLAHDKGGVLFFHMTPVANRVVSGNRLSFTFNTFLSNKVRRGHGGVLYLSFQGAFSPSRKVVGIDLLNNYFGSNQAGILDVEEGYYNGGVLKLSNGFNSHVVLRSENNVYFNNVAMNGGVFFISSVNATQDIVMKNDTFLENRGVDADCSEICQNGIASVLFLQNIDSQVSQKYTFKISIIESSFARNFITTKANLVYIFPDESTMGQMTVFNSFFDSNYAQNHGGCFSLYKTDLYIHGSQFKNNSVGRNGRYIANGGVVYSQLGSMTISQSRFFDNVASFYGAVLYSSNDYFIEIKESSVFERNHAKKAGAVLAMKNVNSLTFDVSSSASVNHAPYGAAIYINSALNETIRSNIQLDGRIYDNTASQAGGGIFFRSDYLDKSKLGAFEENKAIDGPNWATPPSEIFAGTKPSQCKETKTVEGDVNHQFKCSLDGIYFTDHYGQSLSGTSLVELTIVVKLAAKEETIITFETKGSSILFDWQANPDNMKEDDVLAVSFLGKKIDSKIHFDFAHSDPAWWIALTVVLVVVCCGVSILVLGTIIVCCVKVLKEKKSHKKYSTLNDGDGDDDDRLGGDSLADPGKEVIVGDVEEEIEEEEG